MTKLRFIIPLTASITALLPASAAYISKLDNQTALNSGASWQGGTTPGTSDIASWDQTVTADNVVALGGNLSWSGIRILNPGGLVNIADTVNTLTLGAGIDMSNATQNLFLPTKVAVSATQTWNVAAGHSLQIGPDATTTANQGTGRLSGGAGVVITVTGGGLVDLNEGGSTGFADGVGFANYAGKWVIDSGTTLRGERSGATAFGSNTSADAIMLQGGTLAVGDSSAFFGNWTWTTPITLAAGTSSTIDMQLPTNTANTRSLKLMGPIAGSGDVTFKQTATFNSFGNFNLGFIIAQDNPDWSGTITIAGPTENGIDGRLSAVRVGGTNGVGDTATTAGPAGTLGTAKVVNNGVLTLSHSNAWTLPNNISGTGRLNIGGNSSQGTIIGASTQVVTLTGDNSYTGITDFNQGVLTVNLLTNGGVNSPIGAATSDPGNLLFENGTLRYTGAAVTTDRSFTVSGGGNAVIDASGTGAVTFSGAGGAMGFNGSTLTRTLTLSGTNTGANTMGVLIGDNTGKTSLAKTGPGKWILSANNTYNGATTISAGTLQVGTGAADGRIGTGAVTIAADAILDFNYSSAVGTFIAIPAAMNGTGTIVKDGNSQLTLTGHNDGFHGTIQINAGKLAFDAIAAENGAPNIAIASGAMFSLGAAFANNTATIGSLSGAGTVDPNFGPTAGVKTLSVMQSTDTVYAGSINVGSSGRDIALSKSGGGTLTLSGANTYASGTTVNGGTLLLDKTGSGALAATGSLTLGGGNFQIKGASAGSTQTLGNLNLTAYTGSSITLDPNNGSGVTLNLGSAWTRGTGASLLIDYSTANSGSRTVATASATTGAVLTNGIYGWALVKDTTGTVGFATRVGTNITRFDDTTGPTLAAASNDATINFTTLNSSYAGGNQGGTLTMTAGPHAVNSLTIDTTNNYGTIDFGSAENTLALTSSAILVKGAHDETLTGGTIGAANSEVIIHQTGSGVLTVNSVIGGGAGSLTKDGPGTLVLTATSGFTGATVVNAGKLVVNGSLNGTVNVIVNNTGTLSGTGAINAGGVVSVNAGGTLGLAGDDTLHTFNVGAVAFSDTSRFSIELGTASSDQLVVAGGASLSGSIALDIALLAAPTDGFTYTILNGGSPMAGYTDGARFSYQGSNLDDGAIFNVVSGAFSQAFQISYLADGSQDVTLTAVPEPASAMTLVGGIALLLGLRRRR